LTEPAPVSAVLVTTTLGSEAEATRLAGALVTERLAACVQVSGPIQSVYRWQGKVEQAREWTCSAKTTAGRLSELTAMIRQLHSYEVPEIIAVPVLTADPDYQDWLAASVAPEP
jgi:periplasmic divalent cation tolerance protein